MDNTKQIEGDVLHGPVTKRDVVEQRFEKIFPQPPRGNIVDGVFAPESLSVMLDFAKAMATSSQLGEHLRGNVGDCLMLVSMAAHHRLETYSLAQMSYSVNGRIQFEAKFAQALVNTSGLLKHRLDYVHAGEGEERTCACSGTFKGADAPSVYTSPPLRQITPKKSPLWASDPDQQLSYYACRAWARRFASDVLAGFHFEGDELESTVDVSPNRDAPEAAGLHARLASQAAEADDREPFTGELPSGAAVAVTHAATSTGVGEDAPDPGKRTRDHRKPYTGVPVAHTPAAYIRHVGKWLLNYDTEQDVEGPMALRKPNATQCKVTADYRNKVRAIVDQRIAQLRT